LIGKDIQYAARLLSDGQLVAIPTETVYGLAGNAFDERAVTEIFAVKQRPSFDPLIVHTESWEKVKTFVSDIPKEAEQLSAAFMPGALTLLLPKTPKIPDLVTSGSALVAVRIPAHSLALELLSLLSFPLAAPSANPFGYISPTSAAHVEKNLGHKIPYILDGGISNIGVESTIIGFPEGIPTVFRKGGIAIEAIEEIIGKLQIRTHSTSNPTAPGMLLQHYAPRISLVLGNIDELLATHKGRKVGVLSFAKHYALPHSICLSPTANDKEAAQNLFASLRWLDEQPIELIVAELLPEKGLGLAINDRLRRAAVNP
jgi:L-threonylcarbamoyladenylate synthase